MLRWNRTSKTIAAVAAFGVYFALAEWSKLTWVDPIPKGKVVVRLERPFEKFGRFGATSYQLRSNGIFEAAADNYSSGRHSPLLLYEDQRLLGPAHSSIEDIAKIGQGRYLHVRKGLLFSASDNSEINENNRTYWAVLPN